MTILRCVGKDKMLVTPRYGSRIRLQDSCLNRKAAPTGAIQFYPRDKYNRPHREACPVNVFQNDIRASKTTRQLIFRGVEGIYDGLTLDLKLDGDIKDYERAMTVGDEEQNDYRLAVETFESGDK